MKMMKGNGVNGCLNMNVEGNLIALSRHEHFAHLAQIHSSMIAGVVQYYRSIGLTHGFTPQIVGITGACENVDTLFRVENRLGIPLFLSQTGQLLLEHMLQYLPGVHTVIHSCRDEEKEDARHLREFMLTEEEFDCTLAGMTRDHYDEERMFATLLEHVQHAIQSMLVRVIDDHASLLTEVYQRDIRHLMYVAEHPFHVISYEDAVDLLAQNGFPQLTFGDDLEAAHEALIVSLLNPENYSLPVLICRYPKDIKFFNMKVSHDDPQVVLSADLILPFSGESTGAAVREHAYDQLNERLLSSTMYQIHRQRGGTYEDFLWYLDIVKYQRTNPHAGYGIGNERVLQFIFGTDDIRHVSIFSLMNKQTGDWEVMPHRTEYNIRHEHSSSIPKFV